MIVGKTSRAKMDAEWLNHLQQTTSPIGRPEGGDWLTIEEMMDASGRSRGFIQRYVKRHKELYEKAYGTISTEIGAARRTLFYRFLPPLRQPPKKGNRKG